MKNSLNIYCGFVFSVNQETHTHSTLQPPTCTVVPTLIHMLIRFPTLASVQVPSFPPSPRLSRRPSPASNPSLRRLQRIRGVKPFLQPPSLGWSPLEKGLDRAGVAITGGRGGSRGCEMPTSPLGCGLTLAWSGPSLCAPLYLAVKVIKRLLIRGPTEAAAGRARRSLTFLLPVSLTPLCVCVHPAVTL